jgi:hypothetical protein
MAYIYITPEVVTGNSPCRPAQQGGRDICEGSGVASCGWGRGWGWESQRQRYKKLFSAHASGMPIAIRESAGAARATRTRTSPQAAMGVVGGVQWAARSGRGRVWKSRASLGAPGGWPGGSGSLLPRHTHRHRQTQTDTDRHRHADAQTHRHTHGRIQIAGPRGLALLCWRASAERSWRASAGVHTAPPVRVVCVCVCVSVCVCVCVCACACVCPSPRQTPVWSKTPRMARAARIYIYIYIYSLQGGKLPSRMRCVRVCVINLYRRDDRPRRAIYIYTDRYIYMYI